MSPHSSGHGSKSPASRLVRLVRERLGTAFARSIGALWTAEAVSLATGAVEAVVLARLLTPRELGTLTLAFAIPAFVFAIVDAQSQEAVTRFIAEFRAQGQLDRVRAVVAMAVQVDLALVVLGVGSTFALAPWILDTFLDHRLPVAFLVVAAVGTAVGLPSSTAIAVLMADDRSSSIAAAKSSLAVMRSGAVIAAVWAGAGVRGAILATAVSSLGGLVVLATIAGRTMRQSFGGRWAATGILGHERARVLRFMGFTNASSLIASLAKDVDVLVLGWLTGATQVGFYRVARSVSRLSTFLIGPLQALTYNRFAKLVALGAFSKLRVQVRRSLWEVGAPLALGIALVMLAAPHLVRLIATDAYAPAVGPLRWLLAAGAFLTATFWARPLLLALDQVRFLLVATLVTTLLVIPMYFVLTAYADAAGTASARALITGLFGTGISALWGLRALDRRILRTADA